MQGRRCVKKEERGMQRKWKVRKEKMGKEEEEERGQRNAEKEESKKRKKGGKR